MKTIEELEAELDEHREKRSMYAAECVSLRARLVDAQRERDEARETIVALTTAMAEKDLEIATLTAALDERDLEAERGLEQYDRLVHQLADATNETTRVRLEAKREADMLQDRLSESRSEVDRLTDERDELLVRVADAGAELRATREAYLLALADITKLQKMIEVISTSMIRSVTKQRDAYRRGAEAMRNIAASEVYFYASIGREAHDLCDHVRALPIPEES